MSVERHNGSRDRLGVPTIKDLIRSALEDGKTVRQLEADSGYRVKFQTFQELSNNAPKNFPKDITRTITGMAIALGVPETTIVLAYAQSLGVAVSAGSPFTLRVPPGVDRLDPGVQNAFLSLMRNVVRTTVEAPPQPDAPSSGDEDEEAVGVSDGAEDNFAMGSRDISELTGEYRENQGG